MAQPASAVQAAPVTDQPVKQQDRDLHQQMASLMQQSDGGFMPQRRIQASPNHPFYLRHLPTGWDIATVDGKPCWLPTIKKHSLRPGVGLIRTIDEDEEPFDAYARAFERARQKGWTYLSPAEVIPAKFLPENVPAGSYMRTVPCKERFSSSKGTYYLEAWQVPDAVLPDEGQTFTFHDEPYNRWRKWLVESGQIKPPAPRILQRLRKRAAQHVANAEVLDIDKEIRDKRVAERQAFLDAMEQAEVPGEAEPEPAKAKKKGSK